MTAVIAFTLAAVVTFLLRSSMTLTGATSASERVTSSIALVSPAVLTAMIASALLLDHGELVRPSIGETLAIGSAIVCVRRTGNVSFALAVGLPAYWIAAVIGAA